MANIKNLKNRIKSTKGTLKITTAMKLVSASKLNKAQSMVYSTQPYRDALAESVGMVVSLSDGSLNHPFLEKNLGEEEKPDAVLIISSEKGLCGSYNIQLYRKILSFLNESKSECHTYFIGRKVKELLPKMKNDGKTFKFDKMEPSYYELRALSEEIVEDFLNGKYKRLFIAYNEFKTAILFHPRVFQLLPINVDAERQDIYRKMAFQDFIYDDRPEVVDKLFRNSIINSIFRGYLEAQASEHGARMATMDNAAKNSKQMIKKLTLEMNKLRQAAITTELIEVVSGAEALKG